MSNFRIGIDVGPTTTKLGLFNESMDMIDHNQILTDQEISLDELMDLLTALTRHLLSKNNLTIDHLQGVGAAFPSYIDYKKGLVLDTSFLNSLTNAPVRDMLSNRLGVRVQLDNDANAAALATGIGGGLILNGKLYRGMHGMAGEIGHMFVSDSTGYPCTCGVVGCVQSISSGAHMAKYVTDRIKEGEDSSILNYAGTLSNIDMIAVGKALRTNDSLALEVVNRGAEYLGRMFFSLNQIFDINIFIYGGGITKLGSKFIDRMIAAYRHYSLNDQRYPAQFIPAKLGDQASVYGAALLLDQHE